MSGVVQVWTDGARTWMERRRGHKPPPGPGPGGWAAVINHPDGKRVRLVGHSALTTSVRMELTAVIRALESLPPSEIRLFTDFASIPRLMGRSRGSLSAAEELLWYVRISQQQDSDLWLELASQVDRHVSVEFVWVQGHNGDSGNELANTLATRAARRAVASGTAVTVSGDATP